MTALFRRLTARLLLASFVFILLAASISRASELPAPMFTNVTFSGGVNLQFPPYPAAAGYTILSATNPGGPFLANPGFVQVPATNFTLNGTNVLTNIFYPWRLTNTAAPDGFFRLQVTPMSSNDLLTAQVLNRLAYGPTPDELERVRAIGPDAYIAEQLNLEGITDTMDSYVSETTNSVNYDPATNWVYVTLSGTLSSTNIYIYLTQPGDVYVDDIQLVAGTNPATGPNLISNGDFESSLTPPWTVSTNHSGSTIVGGNSHSGGSSLHVVASAGGSTQNSSIWQGCVTSLTNGSAVTLSYWVLPNAYSSRLIIRLSNNGILSSAPGLPTTPTWVYAKASGFASTSSKLYLYLNGAGECYLDDLKVVAGAVAEAGPNLLQNGGFESALAGTWTLDSSVSGSSLDSTISHSGNSSLHLVASASGSTANGVNQVFVPNLTTGQVYTVSYWYSPKSPGRTLTVKLSGSATGILASAPDIDSAGLSRRLGAGMSGIEDLRAWFCLHAVSSKRQLLEVLSQFWENHFVTQWSKSRDFFSQYYGDGNQQDQLASEWEFREMTKWRNAMLNPQCTFYDLLRISAESPAMIDYLDTVNSKGNGNNVANENYARELLELFTHGVDNGYDQNDIVLMSRAWTGWTIELVDPPNLNNPFAPASVTYYPGTNSGSKANIVGVWTFNFKSGNHGTNRGAIFPGKMVPARFGPPWTTRTYGSNLTPGLYQLTIPSRTGTNAIQDGYDVIAHLANLPFAEEYISVKLCRLFVHDNFPNPTTRTELPEYAFYDYTNPDRSAEAELVHQCMLAWENSNPKGQIRAVLSTIFNSDLFRSHGGSVQKVKTPFEFVASSVRALRSVNADGSGTANTDGFSFTTRLNRMGTMGLFDRAEPNGYPEIGDAWISAGTLGERIRYVQAFCIAAGGSGRSDAGNNTCDPVALLKKKLSSGSWNNAGAVADYFIGILYPAEGSGNMGLYRDACLRFLNTKDDGVTTELFSALSNTSTTYDTRVRGMVAMLLTSQRFHEQ